VIFLQELQALEISICFIIYYGGVVVVAKNDKGQMQIYYRWKIAAGQAFFFALV
jgi:hypothetical protein